MSEVAAAPSAPAEQAPAPESVSGSLDSKSTADPKSAVPSPVKRKIKVDKEEFEVTDEELVRGYQTTASATKKAQEVAKLRKEVESDRAQLQSLIDGIKNDPETLWNIAKQLGHDPEKLAEERVWKKIQYEKMSPEGQQALKEKQRADLAEQRIKEIEDENNAKMSQAQSQAAEAEIESDVMKVLELSKRKAEPGLIRRVAEIYESYMLAKKTKPSHEYVVNKLRDFRRQEFAEDLAGTDIEELVNTLPKEFISKLQDHLVKKARTRDLPNHTPSGSAPSNAKAKTERQTIDQFFKNL